MKLLASAILIGVIVLSTAGCSSVTGGVPQVTMGNVAFAPLQKNDYKIIGDVKGESCASRVWLFPIWFIAWTNDDLNGTGSPFKDLTDTALESASYRAIESHKDADAMISPRYEGTTYTFFPFYFQKCVKVSGKAISINKN